MTEAIPNTERVCEKCGAPWANDVGACLACDYKLLPNTGADGGKASEEQFPLTLCKNCGLPWDGPLDQPERVCSCVAETDRVVIEVVRASALDTANQRSDEDAAENFRKGWEAGRADAEARIAEVERERKAWEESCKAAAAGLEEAEDALDAVERSLSELTEAARAVIRRWGNDPAIGDKRLFDVLGSALAGYTGDLAATAHPALLKPTTESGAEDG